MKPRDMHEAHRTATPLELLFDLVSVIAIASAAAGLHHAIAEAHFTEGILKFVAAFFGIWWAWMNYTWFASAYDNDSTLFRLLTMVIMGGALAIAAGINAFFESTDLTLIVIGYVVMRLAMVALWLRVAMYDSAGRGTALWYAGGIAIAQAYWVLLLLTQIEAGVLYCLFFVTGVVLELGVPTLAERSGNTSWHRHHIIERYGLLIIIVLGETLLSAAMALEPITEGFNQAFNQALVEIALSALVVVFSLWWLYFSKEEHLETNALSRALTWGYGHSLVFASGAAVGAGFAVLVDIVTDHAEVGRLVGDYAVAIPVAVFLLGLWFVRDRFVLSGIARYILPIFALLVLIIPILLSSIGIALLLALCVFARSSTVQAKNRPVQG
ncbi:MAG: low temperature requirement protein A [Cyanobacteria bacterium P01_D01_bin.1]